MCLLVENTKFSIDFCGFALRETNFKMLKRTDPINFAELDEEEDYSYGETSEDLCLQDKPPTSKDDFVSPKPLFHLSIDQHLKAINTKIATTSSVSNLPPFDETAFHLGDRNRPFLPNQNSKVESTECVVINIAHPAQYIKDKNSPTAQQSIFFAWTDVNDSTPTEFPGLVQAAYKTQYTIMRHQLRFLHFVAPSTERINTLNSIRRDIPIGRILFHYIGYGYPKTEKGNIYVCDGRPVTITPFSITKVFENIKAPAWFLFDCDNAASFIPVLENHAQLLNSKKEDPNPERHINWDDWFCLCATGKNETLPNNSKLPKDFLTSCIFTPVAMSIFCHILQFYQTSYRDHAALLKYIKTIVSSPNDQLFSLLSAITDAIAADYLKPATFNTIFRKDRFLASVYRNFLLAEYLLLQYDIHPVSYPELPVMCHHPLWQQWNAIMDVFLTSNLTPVPSVCNDFFYRAAQSFTSLIGYDKNNIPQSILTIMCQIPFTDTKDADTAFIKLADFATTSEAHRAKIASAVNFNSLFSQLSKPPSDPASFHALCYLIMSLIQDDKNFIYEIKKEIELSQLIKLLFDQKGYPQFTRSMIAVILASIIPFTKVVKNLCTSHQFLLDVKEAIPTSSPELLLWLFILVKRSFDVGSAPLESFYKDSIHMQIACCMYHKSHECRAAAVAVLSCFMQANEMPLNLALFFMTLPLYHDISYLVRYQFLMFIIRFLTTNQKTLATSFKKMDDANTTSSVRATLQYLYNTPDVDFIGITRKFEEYATLIDQIIKKENALTLAVNASFFMLTYFSRDPHPYIKMTAGKAHGFFYKQILMTDTSNSKMQSISPSFGSYSSSRSENDEESESTETILFETDSEAIYNIALDQMVQSGHFTVSPEIKKRSPSFMTRFNGQIDIPTVHLQLRAQSKALCHQPSRFAFNNLSLEMAVATTNRWVYTVDDSLQIVSGYRARSSISDLGYYQYHNENYIMMCCTDGSISLWKPQQTEISITWRTDPNYLTENVAQLAAYTDNNNMVLTTRGTNGIFAWDITTQQCIREWAPVDKTEVTALTLHPSNPDVCILGFANGSITAVDIRESTTECKKLMTLPLNQRILKLAPNRNGADIIYAASDKGRCLAWNATNNTVQTCNMGLTKTNCFDVHNSLPLLGYSSPDAEPIITSPAGNILYTAKGVSPNSVFSFHRIFPVITYGSTTGELLSYNILHSSDRR